MAPSTAQDASFPKLVGIHVAGGECVFLGIRTVFGRDRYGSVHAGQIRDRRNRASRFASN